MENELKALEHNQTSDVIGLPHGKKAIGCKWIYKIKHNPDESIDKYKARLVAKGYTQVVGVGYFDSFSPIAKVVTVKLFLAIAASNAWIVEHMDINNAFFHLKEEVYMRLPDGYSTPSNKVYKLKRPLYGLKQASREWNCELTTHLLSYGFSQSSHDHCLFMLKTNTSFLALLVYVDDLLIMGSFITKINNVKASLHKAFTIKDLGPVKYYLGLMVARSTNRIFLSQHK